MDIQNVVDMRIALERDILAMLQKFNQETGIAPIRVSLQTGEYSTLGGKERMVFVTNVRVTAEI